MTTARPRIAFQGVPGAFSEDAVRAFWGPDVTTVPCQSFSAVLAAVRNGAADGAVLPVENMVVGSIQSALDALDDFSDGLTIGATIDVPIVHALLGVPGSTLEQVKLVTSHPVALAQCFGCLLDVAACLVHSLADERGFNVFQGRRWGQWCSKLCVDGCACLLAQHGQGMQS